MTITELLRHPGVRGLQKCDAYARADKRFKESAGRYYSGQLTKADISALTQSFDPEVREALISEVDPSLRSPEAP